MSRRQAATIIGLLFSIFAVVAVVSYRESSQAQDDANKVYAPVVSGIAGGSIVSSDAEESPIVADEPAGEGTPFGETLPPDVLAKMREDALKIAGEVKFIPAEGPETAGSVIGIAGKDIKLPDNVYIEGLVMFGMCVDPDGGTHCTDMPLPIYGLRYLDSDVAVSISKKNGRIESYASTTEAKDRNLAAFQWLADAIESEK